MRASTDAPHDVIKPAILASSALAIPCLTPMSAGADEMPILGVLTVGKNADRMEVRGGILSYDTGAFSRRSIPVSSSMARSCFPRPTS